MAQQKKNNSSGRSSGRKQPTSTARKPSSGTKTSAPPRKSVSGKNTAPAGKNTPAAVQEQKPIRREVGGLVLLFLGLIAVVSWFPSEGWLIAALRTGFQGLFGWGYFLVPVALLWGAAILGFHRGRPVQARLICVLLLPMVVGAFVHLAACHREGIFATNFSNGITQLWKLAQMPEIHCGGVISGSIAILLRNSLGGVGSFLVIVVGFVLMMFRALDLSIRDMAEELRQQSRPEYVAENDPESFGLPETPSAPAGKDTRKKAPAAKAQENAGTASAKSRPTLYDQRWEDEKDRLFAEMDIDPKAASRIARKKEPAPKTAAAPTPRKQAVEKTAAARPEPRKTAEELTRDVKPLSMEDAADIAGVEIRSDAMDEAVAPPMAEKPAEKIKIDKDAEAALVAEEIAAGEEEKAEYIYPDLELLNKSKPGDLRGEETLDENEAQLESAIRSFGVGANIVGAVHGPTITRYELMLDKGVKLNKITNLAGDIALSLGVSSVRIAPIPDKISTVGVEVPNRNVKTVWLGDVVDSDAFRSAKSKLSFAVGKDISGNVIIGNIAKMPHVLIAGTTGSGKSVCINSLILSLLYKSTPEEVRMIMIDPKMVELGIYNGMPHLYVPVVTDPKKAAGALQWSVVEMLKRYRLFSEEGVRDIAGYNQIQRNQGKPTLPQVVIIIDELADLMMVASKEVEESICRVAQMGRAAGMHLVVATQRPSADVITGLMKANIPSRIAFAVSSAMESRIILDQQGAEKLIGAGDMLYSPIGQGKPVRVQGAFVTDEEREEIINFIKQASQAEYSDEIIAQIEKAAEDKNAKTEDKDAGKEQNDYDELLPQAVDVIFETKQASVSMLQRRLKLGYSRAARLIDQLEEVGVVGPFEGSKPRQIIITKQQWQEMQYSQGTAPVDTIAAEFAQVAEDDTFAPAEEVLSRPAEDEDEDELPWTEDEVE